MKSLETVYNSEDPMRIVQYYAPDTEWRHGVTLKHGREAIIEELHELFERELRWKRRFALWCFDVNRIAARFEAEWQPSATAVDAPTEWRRSYGTELWQINDNGLMCGRPANAFG